MLNRIKNKLYCVMIKLKHNKVIKFTKLKASNLKIKSYGKNNCIYIEEYCDLKNCRFLFWGSHNSIQINSKSRLDGVTFWIEDDNNSITIGENCTFENGTQLAACEGTEIKIGEDCMFSNNISVRTTDSHSIIDYQGNRTNHAANIYIGSHVWVGLQSLILKGSIIGDNTIIAARSTISSSSPNKSNCIIAGQPAKVIRENCNWCRERI